MSEKILVTPRSLTRNGHPALKKLEDAGFEVVFCTAGMQPSEEELIRLLPGCVGYLAGVEQVSARVLEAAGDLRFISRNGTGYNAIDTEAAGRLGIEILRAEGANARGVAELTLGLIFSLVRSVPFEDTHLKSCSWERRKGVEIASRTLGLVGCGMIGRIVAGMACGIGMKVIAYDPHPDPYFQPSAAFRYGSLDEVYTESDVISLHCPPPRDGRALIDDAAIAKMKQGVYLVNTARGDLIDDEAVLKSLDAGRIAGLAIDAFRAEPPGDNPLVKHDRVIATPHVGAFTEESVNRAVEAAVDNLVDKLRSAPCLTH